MSGLFDKEVNAQKESLKKASRVYACHDDAHKKVCDVNERNKQEKATHM